MLEIFSLPLYPNIHVRARTYCEAKPLQRCNSMTTSPYSAGSTLADNANGGRFVALRQ